MGWITSICSWPTNNKRAWTGLNDFYVLVNFRPVLTKKNWRMDCGVASLRQHIWLPPFFPTRLRFEDYIYRLWIQQERHRRCPRRRGAESTKSNYMPNPPAAEIFNEEVANLLEEDQGHRNAARRAEHCL